MSSFIKAVIGLSSCGLAGVHIASLMVSSAHLLEGLLYIVFFFSLGMYFNKAAADPTFH